MFKGLIEKEEIIKVVVLPGCDDISLVFSRGRIQLKDSVLCRYRRVRSLLAKQTHSTV